MNLGPVLYAQVIVSQTVTSLKTERSPDKEEVYKWLKYF